MLTKKSNWGVIVCGALVLCVVATAIVFPSRNEYATRISQAHKIEFLYAPAPGYAKTYRMLIVTDDNDVFEKLAASIKYRGVWMPFTEVSGNVYKLRITSQDGTEHIIDVLGSNKIKHNNWCIPISSETVQAIKRIVIDNGGTLPDKGILLKLVGDESRGDAD